MSKLRALALAVSLLALAGCGAPALADTAPKPPNSSESDYAEITVKLSDGRSVLCLRDRHVGYGATSCDWGNAK